MKLFLVAKEIPTKSEGFLSELGVAEAIRNMQVAKSMATAPASGYGQVCQLRDPIRPGE